MADLLLIRHARPQSGIVNPGLGEEGVTQAHRLGDWLRSEHVDVLVASPMRRAQETARAIGERLDRKVDATIDELREWDTDLPPRAYQAIEQMTPTDPRAIAIAEGRYEDFVPSLDLPRFQRRARACLEDLFDRWPTGTVAAVSHGGIINAMIGSVLQTPLVFWFNPGYTSVSRLRQVESGRIVVVSVNETAHLRSPVSAPPGPC